VPSQRRCGVSEKQGLVKNWEAICLVINNFKRKRSNIVTDLMHSMIIVFNSNSLLKKSFFLRPVSKILSAGLPGADRSVFEKIPTAMILQD